MELYYRHLTAALKDEGLQSMVHRNQTPKDVQLKVTPPPPFSSQLANFLPCVVVYKL